MKFLTTLSFLFCLQIGLAQNSIWDELLTNYISSEGLVDYTGIQQKKDKLQQYLMYLSTEKPEEYTSEDEKKAFWINTYNAFCVKLVIDNYPIKSILDIQLDSVDVWDFPIANVNEKKYSLNQIEHDIIRKNWSDPRIHAALISGAISCPKFPKMAFTKENLDDQLNKLMFDFINDSKRNKISNTETLISEKFDWFKTDFNEGGNFIDFINEYAVIEANPIIPVKYMPYNWTLNDAKYDKSDILIKQKLYAVHTTYDLLLKRFVSKNGNVDYVHFYDEKERLQKYLNVLASLNINNKWTKKEKKALWINAYNAYTMKLVMDNYPIESIEKVEIAGRSAWDYPFANIGGELYSLNQIEHDILRKEFNDPRIHVGLNCASKSCPRMARLAYTAQNVDIILEAKMKKFINDPFRNRISQKSIDISEIFKWYQDDFTKEGTLIEYLNKYSSVKISKDASIHYMHYDWGLNSSI